MNLVVMFWKAAIMPVHELVSNKKISDLLRHGRQIVTVKCSHFFGPGSILHIVNIDECLYTDDWIFKLEFYESVFSVVFQGANWFGTLSDLQSSNKIASESIGATVGMGSTVSVPEKEYVLH